ncbi:Rap family tetratricopeptide repeat protein [Bacillus gobiensis]|uniref:response regulator aspartate phosphatase n=1 Tax=Bacillus gobiensis TaxID=1441095 RepID=UPI003D20F796
MTYENSYEEVAKMLNQWYTDIKRHNIPQAVAMKDQILHTYPVIEDHQDLLLYFSLLDFRHSLMVQEFPESDRVYQLINKNKGDIKQTDSMIQYYYLFFSGMYEFHKKNYMDAINYYKLAEDKLRLIQDEIESAEFNYKLAIAYYQIDQHFFSLSYAKKAFESFNATEDYIEKTINSEMVLAANKLDLHRYDEAENHYKNALDRAKTHGFRYTESLAYFNLGISYDRRNVLPEAIDCFLKAINIPEHNQSIFCIRSMYMLSRSFYKLERMDEARHWHTQAVSRAKEEGEIEYLAKLNLIHALYDIGDSISIENALDYLSSKDLWSDVAELTLDIAMYYKHHDDFEKAAVYFEKAHQAKDQILIQTEVLS